MAFGFRGHLGLLNRMHVRADNDLVAQELVVLIAFCELTFRESGTPFSANFKTGSYQDSFVFDENTALLLGLYVVLGKLFDCLFIRNPWQTSYGEEMHSNILQ